MQRASKIDPLTLLMIIVVVGVFLTMQLQSYRQNSALPIKKEQPYKTAAPVGSVTPQVP